ncbi:hypothetical protein SAMN04488074_103125 [Lentzea albidocapillata subsp. violacea]|uniref:DUF3592 domain-containing protein n=1 Tax=Lentzea albidocapillata subsp. violacea TaxID=128104 RepID=A0A1G8WB25_9PSEU|nr:hypothetical protein [Lentzea albidocapillata]SDJ75297.1 hypothetical protein SAMN04488074_103125 [Lentzea albidocapillata subsp. violacea]
MKKDGPLPNPDDENYKAQDEPDGNDAIAAIAILVGLVLAFVCIPLFQKSVKIAFDLGTPGTYVVVGVPDCTGFRCYTRTGTFTSDDGKVTRSGVHVRNGLRRGLKQGDRVRAFDIGTADEVFTNEGQNGYPSALPIIFGPAGLLGIGLGLQHFWATRKRRGQSE